jgi:hypothetical protein
MSEKTTKLASLQTPAKEDNNNFPGYLSLHFYRENLDHIAGLTKNSINNFIKTIAEIEDEFLSVIKIPEQKKPELHSFGFDTNEPYLEENY